MANTVLVEQWAGLAASTCLRAGRRSWCSLRWSSTSNTTHLSLSLCVLTVCRRVACCHHISLTKRWFLSDTNSSCQFVTVSTHCDKTSVVHDHSEQKTVGVLHKATSNSNVIIVLGHKNCG